MTHKRLLMAILLAPALLGACKEGDEPTDTSESTSTSADTDPTGASDSTGEPTTTTAAGCEQAACSEMCAGWSDEGCGQPYEGTCQADKCVCDQAPGSCDPVFPAVKCGETMCTDGQICVQPGLDCDYNQDPPVFFTPPPMCQDVPDACLSMTDDDLRFCLGNEFCADSVVGEPEYGAGQLECPAKAADCF